MSIREAPWPHLQLPWINRNYMAKYAELAMAQLYCAIRNISVFNFKTQSRNFLPNWHNLTLQSLNFCTQPFNFFSQSRNFVRKLKCCDWAIVKTGGEFKFWRFFSYITSQNREPIFSSLGITQPSSSNTQLVCAVSQLSCTFTQLSGTFSIGHGLIDRTVT
jgi:hypothetical protein